MALITHANYTALPRTWLLLLLVLRATAPTTTAIVSTAVASATAPHPARWLRPLTPLPLPLLCVRLRVRSGRTRSTPFCPPSG